MHSTASDGTLSPAQVAEVAAAGALEIMALTDHDTVAGILEAQKEAARRGIHLIPGVELSATGPSGEVHILGLGIDPTHTGLVAHTTEALGSRAIRMAQMVARLQDLGLPVTMEAVEAEAGPERESLARPHLARAMVRAGLVGSVWEAFDRYLGDDQVAFVSTAPIPAEEAIRLISAAGGTAIWAHPTDEQLDSGLDILMDSGLHGVEVYRPRILPPRIRRLEALAKSRDLLISGGSDWHGPEGGETLGAFFVEAGRVMPLLERIGVG
jgi:predicted metal-dependent phosphoesterase TrpH